MLATAAGMTVFNLPGQGHILLPVRYPTVANRPSVNGRQRRRHLRYYESNENPQHPRTLLSRALSVEKKPYHCRPRPHEPTKNVPVHPVPCST